MSGIKAYLALHEALGRVGVPSSLGFLRTQLADTITELKEWHGHYEKARNELEAYTGIEDAATDELAERGWHDPKRPDSFYALAEKAAKRDARIDIDREAERLEDAYDRTPDGARFAAAVKAEGKAAWKASELLDKANPFSSEASGDLFDDLRALEEDVARSIKRFEALRSKLPLLAGEYKP